MKNPIKGLLLCAAAAFSLFTAGSASAVSILKFAGSGTLDTNDLFTATEFSLFESAVTGDDGMLNVTLGNTGIFAGMTPPLDIGARAFSFTEAVPFTFLSYGGYDFVIDSILSVKQEIEFGFRDFTFLATGVITNGSLSVPASLSLTSSQTPDGLGSIVSVAGQLSTPVNDFPVPEGGSTLALFGLGLVGAETLRRLKARA